MGVRLVLYDKEFAGVNGSNVPDTTDHNLMVNRDMKNQHPIFAISGLQDALNALEDLIHDVNIMTLQLQEWAKKRTDNLQKQIDDLWAYVRQITFKTVDHIKDTYSVDMHYEDSTKTLSADVNVYPDEHNSIQSLYGGLFVPKVYTDDTESVHWETEYSGETLEEIFNHGDKFSHNGTSWTDKNNTDEMDSWYWDGTNESFRQPCNSKTYNGFVTTQAYDRYTHRATIKSSDSDNDINGLIIGYVVDNDGHPHTLSAVVGRRGMNSLEWGIVYDFHLPDSVILIKKGNGVGGTVPGNYGSGGWNNRSIIVEVTKEENIITATCSDWDGTELNQATKITIDLDNYSWGHLFRKEVKYGYSNFSQAESFYGDIYFKSRAISEWSIMRAYVKLSSKKNNGLTIEPDGLWHEKFIASKEKENILQKKSDGWYVQKTQISKSSENILVEKADGLYVRDQIHTIRKQVTQNGHGFALGDFIYYDPTKGYQKALAVDDYTINIVGAVVNIIDANTFEFQWSGYFATNLFSSGRGFIQGKPIYISATNPGKTVQDQPEISKAVGYPIENNGIIISIERGIQYNMESQVGDFKNYTTTFNVRSDGFIKVYEGIDYNANMINSLLNVLDATFKSTYMQYDAVKDTYQWKNTATLRAANFTPIGMNLFVKAF